ncbi:MAG: major capsid protein [Vicingaceae bacterium]
MSEINVVDARGIFTKRLIEVYKERTAPTGFLRSFFRTVESDTKEISIEVQRGTEKIAVDVERGTSGNRNKFSKSSEKIFVPPYYEEYFDATELTFYDRLFLNNGTVDVVTFGQWMQDVVEKLALLQDKIERSYELQCSQVFQTGIVTLENGDNIDFKRKAASLVDLGAGNYWGDASSDPIKDLENGCKFLRTVGKMQGGTVNAIMGDKALNDFLNNTKVKERADIRNFSLDEINAPQANALGAAPHGWVSAGSYRVYIWTYPEYYDTNEVENIPYINEENVILLPQITKFTLGFGAVPMLLGVGNKEGLGISGRRGAYMVDEYVDKRHKSHNFEIRSAGVAIPTAVDQIYTLQASEEV